MSGTALLIGPCGAGKTTCGRLAAGLMGREFYDLDSLRRRLYAGLGYSRLRALMTYWTGGIWGWYEYQRPYELSGLHRALERYPGALLALGGGMSVYEGELEERFLGMLREFHTHTVLLLPYEDDARSLELLDRRAPDRGSRELNRRFIAAQSNYRAADSIVYTGERSAEEVAALIVRTAHKNPGLS